MINIPFDAPWPLIIPLPVTLENIRTWGISLIRLSISSITTLVCSKFVPGEVRTSTKIVPISSCGTSPVFVVFIKINNPAPAITNNTPANHLCLNIKNTPVLYFITIRWNAVSNAIWKREEKLILPPFPITWGVIIKAHNAGLKVNALTIEIATATAIVRPNCV